MSTHTIEMHRVLRSTPEKVFRAFTEADAWGKWLPPFGFTGQVHALDAQAGGHYRMSFKHFATGHVHSFGGEYIEFVPGEKLRYTAEFDDPNLPGRMQTTITLTAVSCGVALHVKQEGIPAVIPAENCHLGWQESLQQLAWLVEPDMEG
jgi:uncharacterized protein YndB with AHSA1/START domain